MTNYKRRFETLRLSVTKDCNFACTYCSLFSVERTKSLSRKQYVEIVKGINEINKLKSVRLTGGEPTLYKGLIALIGELKELVPKVTLTTNAFILSRLVPKLKSAGLDEINVSCDALDPHIFYNITKSKLLANVLDGVDRALEAGFKVKVNSTLLKGVNDKEIVPLLDHFGVRGIKVRFLELMNMGHLYDSHDGYFISEEEILSVIRDRYRIYPLERECSSTANYWRLSDGRVFGIISNISRPFCYDCNRLRIDHRGYLYGCLSSDKGFYIADRFSDREFLEGVLLEALSHKQKERFKGSQLAMQEIGG